MDNIWYAKVYRLWRSNAYNIKGLGKHGCDSLLNDLACFGCPTDAAHSSQ